MGRTIARQELSNTKVVCIGGGTGVPKSIGALSLLNISPDAVVSVADDGGSSGLLRSHTGQVPPGDLRKCLVALASDQNSPWVQAFKQRFEYANDHALGNLILTALQQTTGSLMESLMLCEDLLQTKGHVIPASLENVTLSGVTQDGLTIQGQSAICKSETALAQVYLEPADIQANPQAVTAIEQAELIVFGPGSLFTSIIPNVLIPGIRNAVLNSNAATVFVCSLADVQGETWGLSAFELIHALEDHGMSGRLNYALINKQKDFKQSGNVTGYFSAIGTNETGAMLQEPEEKQSVRPVVLDEESLMLIRERGIKVLTRQMEDHRRPNWHDSGELAKAFASIIADSKGL